MGDETPISYLALEKGTEVDTASGTVIGTVEHVLQVPELDLFDGLVVATHHGLRFIERDQITEITRSVVRTSVTDEEAADLPKPDGTPVYTVDAFQDVGPSLSAHLGRLFRREHWIPKQ